MAHEDPLTATSVHDPIALIEADHQHQFKLCDALEEIADSLPNKVDPETIDFVIPILRNDLRHHIALEEKVLFPLLRKYTDERPELEKALDQLTHEHAIDETYGDELADHLEHLLSDPSKINTNMIGYMLRGFFESQRRHTEWENTIVLPQARDVLSADDIAYFAREATQNLTERNCSSGAQGNAIDGHSNACSGNCENCKSSS